MIFVDLLHGQLESELIRYGFVPRTAERVLLLSTKTLSEQQREEIVNPNNWLLTGADSDIDRPW